MTDTCRQCGRVPAETFAIRRHVGMLIVQRFVKVKVPLCRDHATALTKQYLGKTLWQGWWGYISFFVNFFVVFADLSVLARAKKMDAPHAPDGAAVAAPPAEQVGFETA